MGYWKWWFSKNTSWKLMAIYWVVVFIVGMYNFMNTVYAFEPTHVIVAWMLFSFHPGFIVGVYLTYDQIRDSYIEYKNTPI